MVNSVTQLHNLNPEQLGKLFGDVVKNQIDSLKLHFEPKKPKTYLSRKEVSEMLNVSFVTLNKWNKSGKLKAVGIGGRVLYRQEDIDNAIVEL